MPDLSNVALFAAAGSLVAFWGQFKGFLARISSLIIKQDVLSIGFTASCFFEVIGDDLRLIRWGSNTFKYDNVYLPAQKGWFTVFFSYFKSYPALYKKWVPLLISEHGTTSGIKISYITGTFPIKKFLERAAQIDREKTLKDLRKKRNNFYVEEVSGKDVVSLTSLGEASKAATSGAAVPEGSPHGFFGLIGNLKYRGEYFGATYAEIDAYSSAPANEDYFWTPEALKLDSEIQFWLENKNWYWERNLSWRRGALLHGPAGTGKSLMVVKCAEKHGIRIRKMNVANMSASEFLEHYNSGPYGEQIILLEDLCSVFQGRENVLASKTHTKQLLSFDTLINAIGGVKNSSGIFTIITANHPERLDAALVRSGRLDAKIDIGPLPREGREFIAKNILRDWPDMLDKAVNECDNFVAAEFENHCIELAIAKKNKEKTN